MLQPGTLNCYVSILRPADGEDDHGQPSVGFVPHAEGWASIVHPRGVEGIRADAVVATRKASIRMYYRTDVTEAMRITHEGTVYTVLAVLPDEVNREHVDFLCEVAR